MKRIVENGIRTEKGRLFPFAVLAVIALLFALPLFSFPVFATQCLTDVSTSTSASRATTGTSVSITVTTTGSSCTVSTLSLVSTPSLTVNDPADGQYSGFSAGTAKAFTVTAGTSGTYTYYARGTTSDGSVDSTSTILEFISPSDLTVTATPSSASVTTGQTFSLTININNPQTSDVTTSYTVNLPSGLTRNAGDPLTSSGTTISASSTKTLSITVAHTASACFTGTKTVTFDLGDSSSAASMTVTGNSSCTSSSSSSSSTGSGSSSGSGSITTKKMYSTNKATITIPVIQGGATESIDLDATETNVRKIEITVKGIARTIEVIVERASLPSGTPAGPGNVYHYISISKNNLSDENINAAKLEFRVEKSWITGNKIDENTISLQRYTTQWDKMATEKLSDDGTYVYYRATLPGFSVFAISGEKTAEGAAEQAQQAAQQNVTENATGGVQLPSNVLDMILWLVVIAVVIGGGYYVYKNFIEKKPYSYGKK
ncbi:MAG: PGF-pre-PGF domain-containing protein [Candidatus Aenigmarchaeota archaeon]|nr:PGF-pre-PGF domain-containing protein [Candidatus Aenigmarchaeota archaeon]